MKHKITVVLCLLAVFIAGAYSVVSYQHYRTWAHAQHDKAVKAQQAQAQANLADQVRFNRELDKLKTQCAKDKAAYAALAPAAKAKATAPDCDLQLVQ